jgi:hypothetical protein
MSGQVRLIIDANKVATSNTYCLNGRTVYVKTSSPALISSDAIHILKTDSNQKQYNSDFFKRKASLDKIILKHYLSQAPPISRNFNSTVIRRWRYDGAK